MPIVKWEVSRGEHKKPMRRRRSRPGKMVRSGFGHRGADRTNYSSRRSAMYRVSHA